MVVLWSNNKQQRSTTRSNSTIFCGADEVITTDCYTARWSFQLRQATVLILVSPSEVSCVWYVRVQITARDVIRVFFFVCGLKKRANEKHSHRTRHPLQYYYSRCVTSTSPIVLRLSNASSRSDRVEFPDMRSVVPCRKEIEKEAFPALPTLLSRMHVTFCLSNSVELNTAALCSFRCVGSAIEGMMMIRAAAVAGGGQGNKETGVELGKNSLCLKQVVGRGRVTLSVEKFGGRLKSDRLTAVQLL